MFGVSVFGHEPFAATTDVTVEITGQSVSVACGSVTAAPGLAVTGQSLSLAQGSLLAAPSLALSGQAATVSRGSVLGANGPALTGSAITAAQGSAAASLSEALTGQALTVARGTVAVGTSDVTLALTGQSVTVARGTVTASPSLAVAGQSAGSMSQGVFEWTRSADLTGQEIAVRQYATLLADSQMPYKFWNPPPLTGRRRSVSRSR